MPNSRAMQNEAQIHEVVRRSSQVCEQSVIQHILSAQSEIPWSALISAQPHRRPRDHRTGEARARLDILVMDQSRSS